MDFSMQITYRCPKCSRDNRVDQFEQQESLVCGSCSHAIAVPESAVVDGHVQRCVVCPSHELFVRKDFPQRLGVGIVVVGLASSCVAWGFAYRFWTYGILFATAAIDALLFLIFSDCLTCYRCGSRYRGPSVTQRHEPFNLETHEKHRQMTARSGAVVTAAVASQPPVSSESSD
jgi:DNA-directed RNA polymerase subunit RPC12/RpoP